MSMNDAIDAVVPRRALLAVLTLAAWPRLPVAAPSASPATVQWSAIELLDGKVLKPADWTDMAAVVVFWSTTCPFCRRHNEHVQKLFAASAGQRLRVLGASLDRDAGAVRRYMADRGYGFPVTLDAARLRPLFTTRAVIPMTCTVDRGGRLLQTIPGEMFEEDVLELGRLAGQPRGG
jgi:thiol-disulfide isomerase/thioredoxin